MLHPFDDYPLHQTPEPFSHPASESPNVYDRYFFNGFADDGSLFFALALGVYPNRQVIDAAFCVIPTGDGAELGAGRIQHSVRASGRCPVDRTRTTVGPISVEVVEPMMCHRITVAGDHRIAADLTAVAASPAIEEPRFTHRVGSRIRFDYTRLTQFCTWNGSITLDGEQIEVSGLSGVRDRSWGIRPVGDRIAGPADMPQFFWLWTPTVFDDVCAHTALNHEADGRPWHQSGALVPRLGAGEPGLDPGRVQRAERVSAQPVWRPGTRWIDSLTARLELWNAEPVEVTYEPLLTFHMGGVGYNHPEWRHGRWLGENESTRDELRLDDVDPASPFHIHVQALCRARSGDRIGVGIVEQLVIGPYEPAGFTSLADGYRP